MSDAAALPVFKLEEVKQHASDKSCWIIVNGNVYDVTAFLEEHPGGYDIIISSTGKDATQDFEEIGHSNSAKELLNKYLIGSFEGGAPVKPQPTAAATTVTRVSTSTRLFNVVLPVVLLAAAVALNYYLSKKQ